MIYRVQFYPQIVRMRYLQVALTWMLFRTFRWHSRARIGRYFHTDRWSLQTQAGLRVVVAHEHMRQRMVRGWRLWRLFLSNRSVGWIPASVRLGRSNQCAHHEMKVVDSKGELGRAEVILVSSVAERVALPGSSLSIRGRRNPLLTLFVASMRAHQARKKVVCGSRENSPFVDLHFVSRQNIDSFCSWWLHLVFALVFNTHLSSSIRNWT